MTNVPKARFQACLARAQVYRLLARGFGRPDRALQSLVKAGRFRRALEEALAALDGTDAIRAVAGLRDSGLDSEFVRLFSPSVDGNCPPYETEYTGAHVFMGAQQLADVAGFYRAFGLTVSSRLRDRPDHIAAELEFMYVLALKEARAFARGERANAGLCRDAQRKFLRDHLGRWLGAYSHRLSARAGEGFYDALAGVARAFVERDARRLRVQPDVVAPGNVSRPEPSLECVLAGGEANAEA